MNEPSSCSLHSLPLIVLNVGSCEAIFRNRCVGLFTGSRSAGAAGRLPLLDVASQRLAVWQRDALKISGTFCCLGTFVDNLATIAETPEKAIAILADCEAALLQRWCLRIGADSKEYMTCRSYPHDICVPAEWQRRSTLKCLGHHLDDDAGISSCFRFCSSAMRKSFYANLSLGLLRASKPAKYKFLNSCVRTIASFRWSRWPYTKTYAAKLDALQRGFLTALLQIKRKPDEPLDAFVQRRHITGGHLATSCGRWSLDWARSVVSWDGHVRRAHDNGTWSHGFLEWRSEAWLSAQRSLFSSFGESRTRTRRYHGRVQQRWQTGVNLANGVS